MRGLSFTCCVAAAVLVLGGVVTVRAQSSGGTVAQKLSLPRAEQLVQNASGGRSHALKVFPGPHGLTGVVVQVQGEPADSIVWMTPDGAAIVAGTLFDGRGNDLNQLALLQLGLRYGASQSLQLASAPAAQGVVVGTHGPTLTIFMDPNCSYCHELYQQLMPEVLKGTLKIRFVMVGVIRPDSPERAAAILATGSIPSALQQDQEQFDSGAEEGGFPINPSKIPAAATATITANNALMAKTGIDGTPAMLYCSKAKSAVQLLVGMPATMESFLADLSAGPAHECAG
jgi:thiol:disulfide interchange protein DsbG